MGQKHHGAFELRVFALSIRYGKWGVHRRRDPHAFQALPVNMYISYSNQ
jgi:hypothetical protein